MKGLAPVFKDQRQKRPFHLLLNSQMSEQRHRRTFRGRELYNLRCAECFLGDYKGRQCLLNAKGTQHTAKASILFLNGSVIQSLFGCINNTPSFPVQHQLPEFTQTHVNRVGDAIQPSHPVLSHSATFNLSQHQFSSVQSLSCV